MTKMDVKKLICKELKMDLCQFDGKDDELFYKLGLDSLDLIELSLCMKEEYGLSIDPIKHKLKTLNELFAILKDHGLED